MELQHIDISKLKLSDVNMRHSKRPPDVSDILPSIKSRGVLVPLLVRPTEGGEDFEIVAGRRRYFAAKAVADERGEVEPLPCAVMEAGDDAAAVEASLIENFARLDPDEMTQYETFARLVKEDRTVAEIANTFGITELMVKRRLALGNLLPKIRAAYRDEDIDEETIRYLTLASKRQQKEWLGLFGDPEQYAPRAWELKKWLFGGQDISTEVALFPLEDYRGQIIADLFSERSYFTDADQFWTLQNQAIAAKRDALLKDGWVEVEILKLGERFQSWKHQKTSKDEGGRVYITVSDRGDVEVHEGYLTTKETAKKRRKAGTQSKGETDAKVKSVQPEITKSMQNYLELHRHVAVRVQLMNHSDAALRLMVAHAIGGSALWSITAEPQSAATEAVSESVATSKAQALFDEERKAVQRLLGLPRHSDTVTRATGDDYRTAQVFAKLLTLSDADVYRVLSFVMAETLEAGAAVVEAVGNHLTVNMVDYWQPNDTFFDLLKNKTVINAILKQVAGKRVADGNVTATGKTQKKIIRDCLAGENNRTKVESWLPDYMAFPFKPYTKNGGIAIQDAWSRVKRLI